MLIYEIQHQALGLNVPLFSESSPMNLFDLLYHDPSRSEMPLGSCAFGLTFGVSVPTFPGAHRSVVQAVRLLSSRRRCLPAMPRLLFLG
jgi:hypothetical protein